MSRKKDTLPKLVGLRSVPWRRWLFKMLALLLLVAAFLGALIFLGQWALEEIRPRDRYQVPFADIDCTPPPGLTRGEFLDEVVYLSRPADPLRLLDDDLPRQLTAAFAKHPWVEKVDSVILQPPRQVQVRLVLRRPVLAVRTAEGLIAVDGYGVRLPKNAVTADLPIFEGEVNPPQGPAGTKWGDLKVEGAARKANNRR